MVDRFQALERAGINIVDRRTLQHHMFELRSLGYQVVDAVLQRPGVGKV
jgi:hypothetical protein